MVLIKKINFQPEMATVPIGYTADTGAAYGLRADGSSFGWVTEASLSNPTHSPINIASYALDRNTIGVEQRLDTLLQMEYSNTPAAAWEYALLNGIYSVTVSVGDQATNSQHRIRVEGKEAISLFQPTSTEKYALGTVTVNVTDGKLTVDSVGGTNTKINYLDIFSVDSGNHPSVPDSFPRSRATNINRDAAVIVDVSLKNIGAGVDATKLNTSNIQLYRTSDNTLVPGNINTTGGGDAIVYQPTMLLDANTNYTFRIGEAVKDTSGASFLPFSTTFTTGTATVPSTPGVNFSKRVYAGFLP